MTENLPTNMDEYTLFFKGLPKELDEKKVVDFLQTFGATTVRFMGTTGSMKFSAFARFPTSDMAASTLRLLHQRPILGRVLRVEYAKKSLSEFFPPYLDAPGRCLGKTTCSSLKTGPHETDPATFDSANSNSNTNTQRKTLIDTAHQQKINFVSQEWDINYVPMPNLRYEYPAPTRTIIANIAHCLTVVPKFYTQVLHLMNRMNLPAPFGELTASPPLTDEEADSEEESELDSDTESTTIIKKKSTKRGNTNFSELLAKRLKSQIAQVSSLPVVPSEKKAKPVSISDVFEVVSEARPPNQVAPGQIITLTPHEQSTDTGGFGMMPTPPLTLSASAPVLPPEVSIISPPQEMDQGESTPLGKTPKMSAHSPPSSFASNAASGATGATTPYITARELAAGRLSVDEQQSHPILKKSEPGEPTNRLYVKNLAKQTTGQELEYIFGRYVDWNNPEELDIFHIRHMTEGRMKGQAFVTLPHIEAASAALSECHAYMLHDKPMSLSYAKAPKDK